MSSKCELGLALSNLEWSVQTDKQTGGLLQFGRVHDLFVRLCERTLLQVPLRRRRAVNRVLLVVAVIQVADGSEARSVY